MDTTHVTVDRTEALKLYRKYKEHRAYSEPIDWEIQRAYQLLAKGKLIIKALESVVAAGVNEESLPKLALARAVAKTCHLERFASGRMTMTTSVQSWRATKANSFEWASDNFTFPRGSFPFQTWGDTSLRQNRSSHAAQVPLVPIHLRPKRGLANYHILWEAEWQKVPPRDPYLLRRIGKADLWLVVAHWDLTEVERAALATRVSVQ